MRFTTVRTITTMLAAVTLLASACGDDDGSETETQATTTTATPTATTDPVSAVPEDLADGTIVFRRFDAGQSQAALFTMASDGSEVARLTQRQADLVDNQPSWSPDGRQIAFMREFPDRAGEVHVVDADGAGDHPVDPGCPAGIPDSQACVEQQPAWSPDGRQIAFSHPYGEITSDGIDVVAISVMDPDGGNLEQLTQHDQPTSAEDLTPVWSPDGHQIAFMRENTRADPLGQTAIFVMQADGTGAQRVTPWDLRAADPDWSPDGQSISFRSEPDSSQDFVGDLYTVAPDGSNLQRLTDHEDGTMVLGSSFSPDSQWIAFGRSGVSGQPDIYVMRTDGRDLTPLTQTPEWDSAPDWSPV